MALAAGAAPAVAAPAAAAASDAPRPTPKLIVAISVDQYSSGLFEGWRNRYTGGLARLAQGVVYGSGFQTHASTETCPGHSTLLTGKHPNKTGIIANSFRDGDKVVYCVNDPGVVLAHDATASPVGPSRLMATTLGDWLKATSPQSRVVAISGKDRAAITMAGHQADGVYWLTGGFGFTTFMPPGSDPAKALAPVAALNARLAPVWTRRPTWVSRNADCRADSGWTIAGKPWTSSLPPANWGVSDAPKTISANVLGSPMADEMTAEGARHLIRAFKLGKGPATDLLAVSFSATDFVGHRFGSGGLEMCDQMHRLDAAIGGLLRDLDALKVPYLVVLSADHGGSDFTERLQRQGYPAQRVDGPAVLKRVNAALMAQLGLAKPPLAGSPEEANLVGVPDADRPRVLAAALAELNRQPEIAGAFSRDDLLAAPPPKGLPPETASLRDRFAMSVYPGRSPDILGAYRYLETATSSLPGEIMASHGSPWDYDRRVPVLFWWPGVRPESRMIPVETVDIAPTLAATVGLTPPADVDGRCLPLPGASPRGCP